MQKWQKDRNYRRFTDKDGNSVNVIRIDGKTVEASDDVFKTYSKMDRQDRYKTNEKASGENVFLDLSAMEKVYEREGLFAPSAEDACVKAELYAALYKALDRLTPRDRDLIVTVTSGKQSERGYARSIDRTQNSVRKRRQRILRDLKRMLDEYGFHDLAGLSR